MKNLFLLVTLLLSISVFSQSNNEVLISPSNGVPDNTSSDNMRISCTKGSGAWQNGCYLLGISCTNSNGLTIGIKIEKCLSSIVSEVPNINNTPKQKLLDIEISFNNVTDENPVELQKNKNGVYNIENDIVFENEIDGSVIIKAGRYKVTNSKMHVIIQRVK